MQERRRQIADSPPPVIDDQDVTPQAIAATDPGRPWRGFGE